MGDTAPQNSSNTPTIEGPFSVSAAGAPSPRFINTTIPYDTNLGPSGAGGSGGNFSGGPKRRGSIFLVVGLLLLLIALPVGVYFISQSQSLNDIRNRAAQTTDPSSGVYGLKCGTVTCIPPNNACINQVCVNLLTDPNNCGVVGNKCTTGYHCTLGRCLSADKLCVIVNGTDSCAAQGKRCHCQDGNACTKTACEPDSQNYTSCLNQGRSWCINQGTEANTCCVEGYTCGANRLGCYLTGPTGTLKTTQPVITTQQSASTNTPTKTPTKTPTPTQPGTSTNTPTKTPTKTPTPTQPGTSTNTPTSTPLITNTPSPTPTPAVGCNETCTVNTDCSAGLVCSDSLCRLNQCLESSTCQCATSTNTPTQTPTPTQALAFVGCDSACSVNTDCSSGLVCVDSSCRNPSCTEMSSCQCEVASAPIPQTPIAGTGPTIMGAAIIAGGFLFILLGLAL